jgi:hypothetical protein
MSEVADTSTGDTGEIPNAMLERLDPGDAKTVFGSWGWGVGDKDTRHDTISDVPRR